VIGIPHLMPGFLSYGIQWITFGIGPDRIIYFVYRDSGPSPKKQAARVP
jgi:hypothetical protein